MRPPSVVDSYQDTGLFVDSLHLYPASVAQQRLWFLDQLQGPTDAYNVHFGLWLYGPLNQTALEASLQAVVNRHEVLRSVFALIGPELKQVVLPLPAIRVPLTDFSQFPDPYPPAYELAQREVGTPFDLSKGPLIRARLMRVNEEEHIFLCTMHHTVTDSWSTQILVRELSLFYEGFANDHPVELPPLPIQFGDYAAWQQESLKEESLQQQLAYWKKKLAGSPSVLQLPQDKPRRGEQSLRGATQTAPIPVQIVERLRLLAGRQQVTTFMLLLTAFKFLLYRYSGEPDVIVGVPVAGRNAVETEPLIGFFVNTLALRDNLSGNPRFIDLLGQVRDTTLAAFASADFPF